MGSALDPRLVELKRLQRALDTASKHLDEFETRAFGRSPKAKARAASTKSAIPAENSFARHIVAGMAKFRQGR
jgi:hypothetical protein